MEENKKRKICLTKFVLISRDLLLDFLFILKKIITKNLTFISRIKIISKDPFESFNKKIIKNDNKLRGLSFISRIILGSQICDYKKISQANKISRELISELLIWAGISKSDLISKEYYNS